MSSRDRIWSAHRKSVRWTPDLVDIPRAEPESRAPVGRCAPTPHRPFAKPPPAATHLNPTLTGA